MDKAREFYISEIDYIYYDEKPDYIDDVDLVHVIEYSAFETLHARVQELENKVNQYENPSDGKCMDVANMREKIQSLEAQLRFAAGYISATEGFTEKHPEDVLQWIGVKTRWACKDEWEKLQEPSREQAK